MEKLQLPSGPDIIDGHYRHVLPNEWRPEPGWGVGKRYNPPGSGNSIFPTTGEFGRVMDGCGNLACLVSIAILGIGAGACGTLYIVTQLKP